MKRKLYNRSKTHRDAAMIAALIIVISFLHYSTDITYAYFHDIYKILYYIPIILAAFRFGVKGGLAASITVSLIYTPHVILDWTSYTQVITNRFVEMIIFNVIGFITGKLVEKERTERYRYENAAGELQVSYDKLQKQSELLAEVEEQLRIADRLATLGELTASLAHEVRNPLAAIKGSAEILRDEYTPGSKNREFAELLISDVDRINKVIENYLGLVSPNKKPHATFDLVAATRTIVQILQAKARKEKKHLSADLPKIPVFIKGDEIKFRQVILNLLLNAFSATQEYGLIRVDVQIHRQDDGSRCAAVAVQDTGCGIAEQDLQKVFKPFYTTREGGTGLGLPISQRIAQEYGWKLEIESQVDEGTTAKLSIEVETEFNAKGKENATIG